MFAVLAVIGNIIMIMTVNIQAPRQSVYRFVRQKNFFCNKKRTGVDFIKVVAVETHCIVIARKKYFLAGFNVFQIPRITYIAKTDEGIVLFALLLIIRTCSSGVIQLGSIEGQSESAKCKSDNM